MKKSLIIIGLLCFTIFGVCGCPNMRNAIRDAHDSVRQEQEARAVSDMFDAINKDYRQKNK